jgi:omega-6 fatty acid desaturase (delta-12 desaturase)
MASRLALDHLDVSVGAAVSRDNVARFQTPSPWRARWQVANSFAPYVVLWFAMVRALAFSYWVMLPIAILA